MLRVVAVVNALALAVVVYVWRFSYFWLDDFNVFYWIQRLDQSLGRMLWDVVNPFSTAFRPVGMLFYWIFWHAFDLNPVPYHVFAWSVHALNVLLLYRLLRKITHSVYGAGFGAFLFAFRANFAEIYFSFGTIFELLALCLMLSALLVYMSEARVPWKMFVVAAIVFLAVKSKEMAITLPAVLLLFEISFRKHRNVAALATFYTLLAAFGVAFAYSKLGTMAGVSRSDPYYLDISAITLGRGYGWYFDHLYNVRLRWAGWFIVALLLAALFVYLRERRGLFFLGYIYLTLLPVIFLVNHRFEFFWYIPFAGVAGLVALSVAALETRIPGRVAAVAFVALAAAHATYEFRSSTAVIGEEKSLADEYRTFVAGLEQMSPPASSTVSFRSMPRHFTRETLLSATQAVLHRTDVSIELVR